MKDAFLSILPIYCRYDNINRWIDLQQYFLFCVFWPWIRGGGKVLEWFSSFDDENDDDESEIDEISISSGAERKITGKLLYYFAQHIFSLRLKSPRCTLLDVSELLGSTLYKDKLFHSINQHCLPFFFLMVSYKNSSRRFYVREKLLIWKFSCYAWTWADVIRRALNFYIEFHQALSMTGVMKEEEITKDKHETLPEMKAWKTTYWATF